MSMVIIGGNVVKDAVIRKSTNGKLVELFTVAVSRRFKPENADFINVSKIIDDENDAVMKGDSVRVTGYLHSYKTKAGQTRMLLNARGVTHVVQRKYRPNFVMISGRLTRDAEISEVNGHWRMRFTIAENHGEKRPATFVRIEQWRNAEPKFTIHKGEFVYVMGSIQVSNVEKDGVWYENVRVIAEDIETAISSNAPSSRKEETMGADENTDSSAADTNNIETVDSEMELPDFKDFDELSDDCEVPF